MNQRIFNNKRSHGFSCRGVLFTMIIASSTILSGCMSTTPSLGGSSGNTITGGAGGANSENANSALERCESTLGTISLFEDRSLPWWGDYRRRYPDLGSTMPVVRTMIQQSNCFIIVERGATLEALNRERQLMQSGQLRSTTNIGGGQMVGADYTLSPSIQFSAKGTGGLKGIAGGLFGSFGSAIGGGLSKNEAATTLLLIDNRSGVQVSSAVGSAGNYDFDLFGGFFAGIGAGAKGFSNSPEGKIITAAFADSYNQMVMALRNYKPQQVEGGLGTGGLLTVDGQANATSGAGLIPVSTQSTAPVYVETISNSRVTTNSDFNARINSYDEDALEDYYERLKSAAETLAGMAEMGSVGGKTVGGMDFEAAMRAAFNMISSQIEGASIELEAWPPAARAEGWRVLGSRIERYTQMFNKNRDRALAANTLDPDVTATLQDIRLLSKEDFLR